MSAVIQLFKSILEASLFASVLIVVVLLIKAIAKDKINGKMVSFLWLLVVLRLCLPGMLESPVHTDGWFPKMQAVIEPVLSNPSPAYTNTAANTPGFGFPDNSHVTSENKSNPNDLTISEPENLSFWNSAMRFIRSCNLWLVAAVIWITGGAIVLLLAFWESIVFCLHIKKSSHPLTDAAILDILSKHERDCHLRQSVKFSVFPFIQMPLTFGVLHPHILLPLHWTDELCKEHINAILLHEVCHIKRNDVLKSYVCMLVKALHWFNPLVWWSVGKIKEDMEFACDREVLNRMSQDKSIQYCESLLFAARMMKRSRIPQLATSLCGNQSNLKKRIVKMIKPQRKSKSAIALSLVAVMMMCIPCFTTACKPTPEKPIVQSKANDSVAQAIKDSADGNKYTFAAPASFQSQAKEEARHITINVDAKVDVPTDTWGLYALKPQDPTFEDVQTMLNAIVGNATIYGEQTIKSKEYLTEQITQLEKQKAEFERLLSEKENDQNGSNTAQKTPNSGPSRISDLTEEDLKRNIENFTNSINEAKAQLPTAPAEDTVVKNKFVLSDMFKGDITPEQAIQSGFSHDNGSSYLNGTVDLGKQTPADISMGIYKNGNSSRFTLRLISYDDYEKSFTAGISYTGQKLFKCNISVEDAAAIARAKVKEMGFGYLDIDANLACEMLDRKRMEGDRLPGCFEFVFTRSMDGATATFARGDGLVTNDEKQELEYAPYWAVDEVKVYVDDSGVIGVTVDTLKSDVARQAYGIQLKDFEKIMDIFKTQVFIENTFQNESYTEKALNREIHINHIRLGYMPTAWKDHDGQIIYVPVWDFFGYEVVTYEKGIGGDFGTALDKDNRLTTDFGDQSLLTINALDGTIMTRQ